MKKTFVILIIIFISISAFSTDQKPDYLIINNDTLSIFSNPLEQYFRKKKTNFNKLFEEYYSENLPNGLTLEYIIPTNCWRGYVAYWKIKNDSLKLVTVEDCCNCIKMSSNQIIEKIFGKQKEFADWYSGTLTIPKGKMFSGSNMGYSAISEYEEKIEIKKGIVINKYTKSNKKLIEYIRADEEFTKKIELLKDTLLQYIQKSMNWKKLSNSKTKWCDDEYLLSYNFLGKLKSVKLMTYHTDTTHFWKKFYNCRMNRHCSRKIKHSLKKLSLNYLKPQNRFMIKITLNYNNELKIIECNRYYDITDKEIEKWIKKK